MIDQHEFVAQCQARYKEEGAYPGDGDVWEEAHYPLPKSLGDKTIWLRNDDHQVQGLLQSEEVGQRCFWAADVRHFLTNGPFVDNWFDLWDLYDKWCGAVKYPEDHGERVRHGILANSTPEERSIRAKNNWTSVSIEERSARGTLAWQNKTPEERSAIANKGIQTLRERRTEEQLIELSRKKSRGRNPRPIILTTPDGEEIWFELMYDARMAYGISSSYLSHLCSGRSKSYRGFKARYADE